MNMTLSEQLVKHAVNTIPALRTQDKTCVEIEGAEGTFLCREGHPIPDDYVKLATIHDNGEQFHIYTH